MNSPYQQFDSAARISRKWAWRDPRCRPRQMSEDGAQTTSAVKEALQPAEAGICAPPDADGVFCAGKRHLDVGQGRVDCQEGEIIGARLTPGRELGHVADAGTTYAVEAPWFVGSQRGSRRQPLCGKCPDRGLGEVPLRQALKVPLVGPIDLRCSHEGTPVGRAAASLYALDLAAEVNIVDLDPAGELIHRNA